jgi:hypothetical protein
VVGKIDGLKQAVEILIHLFKIPIGKEVKLLWSMLERSVVLVHVLEQRLGCSPN